MAHDARHKEQGSGQMAKWYQRKRERSGEGEIGGTTGRKINLLP